MSSDRSQIYRSSSNFTEFGKGFLNPSLYPVAWGWGTKMSRVSFNRKRVKLKQLLGIRARLALLALILVAPLMLERARSLEDTRAKQIALASAEFSNLAQHSADAQREVISSVETMLKSAAYIRASAGGVGRSCDHPARQPAGQSAVDPQPVDRRQGRPRPMLDQQHLRRPRSQRPRLSQEGARDPRASSSATFCSPSSPTGRS